MKLREDRPLAQAARHIFGLRSECYPHDTRHLRCRKPVGIEFDGSHNASFLNSWVRFQRDFRLADASFLADVLFDAFFQLTKFFDSRRRFGKVVPDFLQKRGVVALVHFYPSLATEYWFAQLCRPLRSRRTHQAIARRTTKIANASENRTL